MKAVVIENPSPRSSQLESETTRSRFLANKGDVVRDGPGGRFGGLVADVDVDAADAGATAAGDAERDAAAVAAGAAADARPATPATRRPPARCLRAGGTRQ